MNNAEEGKFESEVKAKAARLQQICKEGYQSAKNVVKENTVEEAELQSYLSLRKLKPNVQTAVKSLESISELETICNKTQDEFNKTISELINEEKRTMVIRDILEKQKIEALGVLQQYEHVIKELKTGLKQIQQEYKTVIAERWKKRELLRERVDNIIVQLENTCKEEVAAFKEAISERANEKTNKTNDESHEFDNKRATKAINSKMWIDRIDKLTSEDVRDAFVEGQSKISDLRKKLFDNVLELKIQMEKDRVQYVIYKEKYQREVSEMRKQYRENMLTLTSYQRKIANLLGKKTEYLDQLKELQNEMDAVKTLHEKDYSKMCDRLNAIKDLNKQSKLQDIVKYYKVFKVRDMEAREMLIDILKTDKLIHEEILNIPWTAPDMEFLKPRSDRPVSNAPLVNTDAMDLDTLLTHLAGATGYILDERWVNYLKSVSEEERKLVTLGELFQIFHIEPEDLRELKNHMMKYCKTGASSEMIDYQGILQGFQSYLVYKTNPPSATLPAKYSKVLKYDKSYWNAFIEALPQDECLWDAVEQALTCYWQNLKKRQSLLRKRDEIIHQNRELGRCMGYYTPPED